MTRSGTSIGAQNARGVLSGRCSTSRWTFACERRSIPSSDERGLERGQHSVRGELRIPGDRPEDARDVPARGLVEPDPGALAEEAVRRLLPEPLGRLEHGPALVRERLERHAEAIAVELEVRACAELDRSGVRGEPALVQDRVQVLVAELGPRRLEPAPPLAVRLVRHGWAEHAERDRLAVHGRLELGLQRCLLLGVLARQLAEVPLAREPPQLEEAPVAVHRFSHGARGLEARQVRIALVDRGELERFLQASEVEVVLLVERGDEAVGLLAQPLELVLGRRRASHAS